ncbi:MAG TPA: magnesium transporter CorA family protein [Candidatus Saccharimonadales bacterium]|nr:magnesium transporter CorA family protein [Candidatus Saccharimonadales bacterium]
MIKYYFKSLRSERMHELDAYKPGCWVYVEAPSQEEIAMLVQKFGLTEGHLHDALDEDEMPRLEKEGDQSYIFVRFAYKTQDGELITAPLLFIFGNDIVITVSLVRLPALDSFLSGKISFATTQRAKLILLILQQIVEQYDGFITRTSKQIKLIRSRLRGHEISNQDFIDFVMIEDELNEFLSSLMPTNATLRRLLLGRYMPLFAEDQDIVEDLLLNNEQSIEACNSNMQSIMHIREAYTSISSNNLNRTMKMLTAATVIIALPNVVFSMYGMNVPLPWQELAWVYPLLVMFTLVLVLLTILIARRKRIF